MKAIVTGAAGGLGQAITKSLGGAEMEVLAPGKEQLDVTSPDSVKVFLSPSKTLIFLSAMPA